MGPFTLLWSIVLATVAASCSAQYVASPGSITIAPKLEYAIPSGRELGHSIEATQLITAHFRDQTQVFEAYISVTPDRVTVVCLDPFGGRAMTITATDDAIHSEVAPMVPGLLRPGNILADITIVYWPAPAVRAALAGTSASLYDDERERSISFDDRKIVEVTYDGPHENSWTKTAHLRNIAFGYELDLQSTVTSR